MVRGLGQRLTGVAHYLNGTVAEAKIDLRFDVGDENDNAPVFPSVAPVSVNESSPAGTLVTTFTADDADKLGTLNAKINYTIIQQKPVEDKHYFSIDENTGSIYVKEDMLDRERQDSYILKVKGVDMGGAANGKSGTGTIEIKVLDINDNLPTLEKDMYKAEIIENVANVEVMRIKALDEDLEPTDNWLAVFDIIAGNEDGIFSIKTDPDTNEGIIMLEKPVDFEVNPDIQLGIVVANVAPMADLGLGLGADAGLDLGLDGEGGGGGAGGGDGEGEGLGGGASPAGGGGAGASGPDLGLGGGAGAGGKPRRKRPKKKRKRPKGKVYALDISVKNEPEGVDFEPEVMNVPVSENPDELPEGGVIAVYPAIDADTGKPSEDVTYAKGFDPENLLLIDPDTAEIRLQRAPDRESPFVVNGTYIAKIIGLMKDMPSQTATGTIALQVLDSNDNCPTLTSTLEYICFDVQVLEITGQDKDGDPNGAPFSFKLVPESSRGEWEIEQVDGVHPNLRALSPLWPGVYEVVVLVYDQQGLSCPQPQTLELHVCSCEGAESCAPGTALKASQKEGSASGIGGMGAVAVLLALLALLIAAVLLTTCRFGKVPGAFSDIPFFTEDHLMVYHTEGQGEDKDFPLLSSPVHMATGGHSQHMVTSKSVRTTAQANATSAFGTHMNIHMYEAGGRVGGSGRIRQSSFGESGQSQGDVSVIAEEEVPFENMLDIALPDVFLHEFYAQKSSHANLMENARDSLLVYEFEGHGSSASSVGCCSSLDSDDDLHFLNDLELKFKRLAEICAPLVPPLPPPTTTSASTSATPPSTSPSVPTYQSPPTASIAPTFSTSREPTFAKTSNQTLQNRNFSNVTNIHEQNVCDQNIATIQKSESLANLTQDATTFSVKESTRILQSPPISPQSAVMAPPLGQAVVLQQQPVYYITSPIMQPTSPVLQPSMHYVVQPQVQNRPAFVFAQPQAANTQGFVLLNNGFGTMEHIVYPGAQAMSLGRSVIGQYKESARVSGSQKSGKNLGKPGRRVSESAMNSSASVGVFEIGQHLAAERYPGSQKSGMHSGKQGRSMSQSRVNSAASISVFDIGQYVDAEQVYGSQKIGGHTSEGWLNSEGYADLAHSSNMVNSGGVQTRRKTRNQNSVSNDQ
ncbi:desmoglein-2.1-like [Eucyclogobius newberryi]|uniref:desmoglein-2.1-like n=1 Tax=Eucyclogobius newberryi TaxID=166745 RepID=UPI003B5BDC6A